MDFKDAHRPDCNCSRCGGSKRDSEHFSYRYRKSDADDRSMPKYSNSHMSMVKKIALVAVIAIIGVGSGIYLLLGLQGVSRSSDLPVIQQTPKTTDAGTTSMSTTSVTTQEQSKVSTSVVTQQPILPPTQTINQQILNQQLVLFGKETSEVSPVNVPIKNNGMLEAQITPEKGTTLEAKFYKNGQIFCPEGAASCAFTVTGNDAASQKIVIPVKSGDAVSALISNNKSISGFAQEATIVFVVPYEELKTTMNNIP